MNILFFGDIVGKIGRKAIIKILPTLKKEFQADVVLANVENLAHGKGITRSTLQEVIDGGVDIGTGGDHLLEKPEALEILAVEPNIIVRPANLPADTPGSGEKTFMVSGKKVVVINLLGQFGMSHPPVESPFKVMERWLAHPRSSSDAVIVELHAEATSEKVAMGWLLDGQVSLVIGSHTHVPTADERVLPRGTAYITDVGMVGLRDSSLGVDKDIAIQRFLTDEKVRFEIPEQGVVAVNAVAVSIVDGKATKITRIHREVEIG